MSDKILDDISLDFDIKNHRELTPYVYFTQNALDTATSNSYNSSDVKNRSHETWTTEVIKGIEEDVYSEKYYGKEKDNVQKFHKYIISRLKRCLSVDTPSESIEKQFCHSIDIVKSQQSDLSSLLDYLKKKMKSDFRQMPVPTKDFPRFTEESSDSNHSDGESNVDGDKNLKKDNEKINEILSKIPDKNKPDQNKYDLSLDDLTQLYEILEKNKKTFSFSPSFILSCIQKLDSFINLLISPENKPDQNSTEKVESDDQKQFKIFLNLNSKNDNNDENQTLLKYYRLSLLIKMRLNLQVNKANDFLLLLLELIHFDEKHKIDGIDYDHFSFKKIIEEALPETNRRAKIVRNISVDDILDFSFSCDEKNDFVLTKDGVFQVSRDNCLTRVEFKDEEEDKKVKEILSKSSNDGAKITVENGFLYLLCTEDKAIHKAAIKTSVEKEQEKSKKNANRYQKEENSEENDKPLSKKRLREKERRERKKQRRDKAEMKEEVNLDSVSINIPDLPLLSIGSFVNYIRVIQRKSSENGKTKLVLTNVDLTPNNRFNYDINEAFLVAPSDQQIKQTQIEIEIDDRLKKFKVCNATFSSNYLFVSFDDSSFEQWMIFDDGTVSLMKTVISPFVFTSQSQHKIDNNAFLHVCQPIMNSKEKAVSFVKMHLPSTKYYLRSDSSIFLEHPYLQQISDIVDNCSHLAINRKPTNYFTSAEYHEVKDRSIFDDDDDKKKKNTQIIIKNPFEFKVSPKEMGSLILSVSSIYSQVDFIKSLINDLKDENLKRFFASLFIKIFGINLLYGTVYTYSSKEKMGNSTMKMYGKFKEFIFDMFSSTESSNNSIDFEFMIRESIISTLSFSGKLLFLPNSFDEFHSFVHKIFKLEGENNDPNLRLLLRSISYLMFYYPTSMYMIDSTIYNELLKFEDEINLHDLFLDSSLFTILEIRFAEKLMTTEFIENISPYIESLFSYINHLLADESHPLIETEQILSYFFGIDNDDAIFALMMEKNLVSISKNLFDRVHKIPDVVESDKEFYERNKDIGDSKVTKVTKVLESEHPYNLNSPKLSEEKEKEINEKILKRKEEKRKKLEEKKKQLEERKRKREEKRKKRNEKRKKENENEASKEKEQKDLESKEEKENSEDNEKEKDNEEKGKDDVEKEKDDVEKEKDDVEKEKDDVEKEKDDEEEEKEEDTYSDSDDSDEYDDSNNKKAVDDIGVIDFGSDVGEIYLIVDNQTKLHSNDRLILNIKNDDSNPTTIADEEDFKLNSAIKYESNQIRVQLSRKLWKSNATQQPLWGYKLTFIGYTFDNPFYWKPNIHLYFFNHYIRFLIQMYSNAIRSTDMDDSEKGFQLILDENIIQGIKLEEIDNYEENMKLSKQNKENNKKSIKRTLTRGISRGINYDTNNDNVYDDQFKKSFLNDIITANDESQTLGKQILDILYSRTAKQNKIRITQATKSILENERYLAACLFKQLGLINVCIHFARNIKNNDEIPSNLLSLWKNIYSLRKTLFFEYQKSKSVTNSNSNSELKYNFTKYSEEIKRKCKLLLYSDPILKFKEKGNLDSDAIESATKSIFSFVTSKMPLSNVSEIINIRRKRLSISSQSISFMSSFIENNVLFQSSKPIIAYLYESVNPSSNCGGVTKHELDDFSKQIGELSYRINQILLHEPSFALISTHNFLSSSLFNKQDDESRNKSSKLLIDLLEKNKTNQSFFHDRVNFVSILALLAIASKSRNNQLTDYLVSLLPSDEIDLISKKLLLLVIPGLKLLIPDNLKASDKSLALSILSSNRKSPIIISSIFYWIAELINDKEDESDSEFIKKVLKGIGQAFIGKSCLFIDESFQQFAHRQVSEGMISFIRILANYGNPTMHKIIHDILSNSITKIKINNQDDDMIISLGLFVSLGQYLSAFEPDRKMSSSSSYLNIEPIVGYNTSLHSLRCCGFLSNRNINGFFVNNVLFHANKVILNDNEVKNIFKLHETLSNSKYFTDEQKYDEEIKENEIAENILISSFYSFLPIIAQNKKNASLLMNNENISNCLSLFKFATKSVSLNQNSFLLLSHYLEKAINSNLYQAKQNNQSCFVDKKGSFRFIKMNFGEIIYSDEKDIIKSLYNHRNLFICSRPLDFSYESYFEVKFNKVGGRRVFLGIIDSEEHSLNEAIGIGSVGCDDIFGRRSPLLAEKLSNIADEFAIKEQLLKDEDEEKEDEKSNQFRFKDGDSIGLYYTKDFLYLTMNKKITPYRISHKSVQTYVPLILIDHDEIELEVTENITKVDLSDSKFSFLNLSDLPSDFFKEKELNDSDQFHVYLSSGKFKEKKHFIGQQVYFSKNIAFEKKCKFETIEAFPKELLKYREQYGIIKDIIPFNENRFVTKLKIEIYNNHTLSKDIIEVNSRYVEKVNTNFFNLIENNTNTKFGLNNSNDLNHFPQEYKDTSDINKMTVYLKNKTIKDNSKAIAITMTRYLSFILVDYLRYSKSTLLQDEGINSEEMNVIIKSLAISLPSIISFSPKVFHNFDNEKIKKYIIFSDESDANDVQKDEDSEYNNFLASCKPPGFNSLYNKAFKVFLKKSETFISNQFMKKLIQESFNHTNGFEKIKSDTLFEMIPSRYRMESLSPLPDKFKLKMEIDKNDVDNLLITGFIPILVSSIPEQLPCAKCLNKRMRQTSDNISYYFKSDKSDITFKWKYSVDKLKKLKFNQNKSFDPENYKDYKFKYGIFMLPKQLNEYLLFNCSLGFIQLIYILLQMLNSSEDFNKKHKEVINIEFISNLFQLSSKKNPISSPFLQMIIVSFISKNGLTDSLLTHNILNSNSIFTDESCKLFELTTFPNFLNELPLLLSIFSTLSQTRINELSLNNDENDLSSLFEKYYHINDELFEICDAEMDKNQLKYIEGNKKIKSSNWLFLFLRGRSDDKDEKTRKKNFRNLYLVYYYSILLRNEINLPYPKFLFVHDWLMQHFGGFRKAIGFTDVKKYKDNNKNRDEKEVEFKSEVIENDFDLLCSYKYINVYESNDDDDDDDIDTDSDNDDDDIDTDSDEINLSDEEEKGDDDECDDEEKEKKKKEKENKTKKNKFECYKVFIHQIKDDSRIELPQTGESVAVSFPLEIIVRHENGKKPMKKKFTDGNAFIVDFSPSKEQEKDYFINNYKTIEANFHEFTSMSQLDNKIADKELNDKEEKIDNSSKENNNDNENNNNNENNNDNENDDENNNNNNNDSDYENDDENDDGESNNSNKESNGDEYKAYGIEQIPKAVSIKLPDQTVNESVLSLRLFAHSAYRKLIEDIIVSYASKDEDEDLCESKDEKVENCYMNQIISPAYSMTTEAKFKFINQILSNEQKVESSVNIVFNRFEQQKFMDKFGPHAKKDDQQSEKVNKLRPFLVQFIEQVDEESIPQLKAHRTQPFKCDLVGENSIDSGGPGRELFSSLIVELMNDHIGVFTYNPNRRHHCGDHNQEDLIPDTQSYSQKEDNDNETQEFSEETISLLQKRFVYAGALIACCIVSSLPQPMKLSSIVWDYLAHEEVSIHSIYEIDNNFKELIQTAESLQEAILSKSITEEQFERVFLHVFEINDSFDHSIELIPSGSKTKVTKENLREFIELAKNKRIHEFDKELKDLKEGFDKIMTDKNITKILRPNELKLLVCGEPNCDVEQMKKLIEISTDFSCDDEQEAKFKEMFWNVMKSFTVEERMNFIKFSSGNLGLPAPGLKWAENIKINVYSKEEKENGKVNMIHAHTCFSKVDCPYFESEEELTKIIKMTDFGGLITDSHENFEQITDFL